RVRYVTGVQTSALPMLCSAVVVTAPPLIAVVPPVFVVRLVSGAVLPTAKLKLVVPLSFTVSAWAPFTVPLKVLPTPVRMVAAPRSEERRVGKEAGAVTA